MRSGDALGGVAVATLAAVLHELEPIFRQAAVVATVESSGPRRWMVAFTLASIVLTAQHYPRGSVIRRRLARAAVPLRDEMATWPEAIGGDG